MRYTNKDWEAAYRHSRGVLKCFLNGPGCNYPVAVMAQTMLKAHYRGPWRMIAAITARELASLWQCHGWPKWNWIRVNIFRRPQDEAIAAYEREAAEEEELMRIGRGL